MILSLLLRSPLQSGSREGPSPCQPAGCAGVARCLVIPSPTGPSPSFPTLSSPPPHHDKPDLLSIKEPPATCSFSPNLPPRPFRIQCSLIPFVICVGPGLARLQGAVLPGVGLEKGFLAGKRPPTLLQVATFRKAPNGFGQFC